MRTIRLQRDPFDPGVELGALEALGGGGVASFIGVVRGGDGLESLTLEHYPGMTEAALTDIAEKAADRWGLLGVTLIHRYGTLVPGDRIVLAAAAARHRGAALEAVSFLIDWAKSRAPFWKREVFADGTARWVEPRGTDEVAATRWDR